MQVVDTASACFPGALKGVARRARVDVTAGAVTVDVGIGPHDAHQVCRYSTATRGTVDVPLTIA